MDAVLAPVDEEPYFEPAQLLAELVAAAKDDPEHPRPDQLSLSEITRMPELFQPRGMSEKHINDLIRAIKASGELDPLTVLAVGQRAILVDGHHRLEAYLQAGTLDSVAVRYFEGTPQQALLEAGVANSKAKLPMQNHERQNYAWRLVLLNQHSKAEIASSSGVSSSQVANMRKARRDLGSAAFDYSSWWHAKRKAQGEAEEMSPEDREQWKEDMANRFADRLAHHFSTKLADKPEIAAMALATYFGRRLPELVNELRGFVQDDDDDNDEF